MKKLLLLTFAILLFNCELDQEPATAELEAEIEETEVVVIETVEPEPVIEEEIIEEPEPVILEEEEEEPVEIIPETEPETEPIIINYTTRFILIPRTHRDSTTLVTLDYPNITHSGTEFNIETMAADVNGFEVKTNYTDTERLVYINMDFKFGGMDSFIFSQSYDNWGVHFPEFTIDELTVDNMNTFLDKLNYTEPVPDYETLLFNLSGTCQGTVDVLELTDDSYLINDIETSFMDAEGATVETIKTIAIRINTYSKNSFLFGNGNMFRFLGFDFIDMSLEELTIAIDVLERYGTGEYLLNVVFEYYPNNPVLVEMGYFDD
jgi:hypothetical protein